MLPGRLGPASTGGAANDAIVAYDLASGSELWRVTLPFGGDTSTEWIAWIGAVKDGRVYASRSSNLQPQPLIALDAATGATLWTSQLAFETWAHDGLVFAPDGDVIIGDRLSITRLESTDGSTVWQSIRTCPVSGNCGAAATPTAVFIDEAGPGGNVITKLDVQTGAPLYSSQVMPGFTEQLPERQMLHRLAVQKTSDVAVAPALQEFRTFRDHTQGDLLAVDADDLFVSHALEFAAAGHQIGLDIQPFLLIRSKA